MSETKDPMANKVTPYIDVCYGDSLSPLSRKQKVWTWVANFMIYGSWVMDLPRLLFYGAAFLISFLGGFILGGCFFAIFLIIAAVFILTAILSLIICFIPFLLCRGTFSSCYQLTLLFLSVITFSPIWIPIVALLFISGLIGLMPCVRKSSLFESIKDMVKMAISKHSQKHSQINFSATSSASRFFVGACTASVLMIQGFIVLLCAPLFLLCAIFRVCGYVLGACFGLLTTPLLFFGDPSIRNIKKEFESESNDCWLLQYLILYSNNQKVASSANIAANEDSEAEASKHNRLVSWLFNLFTIHSFFFDEKEKNIEKQIRFQEQIGSQIEKSAPFKAAVDEYKKEGVTYTKENKKDISNIIVSYLGPKGSVVASIP